jgi:hypothetical protein
VRLDSINILDISPLILTLMGIPVPSDMEGHVPTEALVGDREVSRGAATAAPDTNASDRAEATEEEREALMSQLKVLGYMD